MSIFIANSSHAKRRSRKQLFQSDKEDNVSERSESSETDEGIHNRQVSKVEWWFFFSVWSTSVFSFSMHKSTKTGLIGIAILLCVVVVIVLLNLGNIRGSKEDACVRLEGEKVCHSTNPDPYRFYGTKTAYHVVTTNNEDYKFDVEGCEPKLFYILSRHATRYPDKDGIVEMAGILPRLKNHIINSSLHNNVNICKEDIERLSNWTMTMKPEDDNKITITGEKEAYDLAKRYKERFPSILNQSYSENAFIIEYTSRERTRSTAESFAKGLFEEEYKTINFDKKTNDKVLNFHKECKALQKNCKDPSYDISQIERFEKGHLMQKVIDSISKRVGFRLDPDEVIVMYKACFFGYALGNDDVWCSLFARDELKVLEFGDDIDDYYKDAYGNEVNYKQACPAVKYIMDLFKSANATETKAVMQFSHAGGVKKVYSMFGLFRDEHPLMADDFCSQQDRKWRSSLIAPFQSNLAFVLHECGKELKIVAYLNEKPVKLGGCESTLCSLTEFYNAYNSIAESCDINKLCCTCCIQ